MTDHIVAGSVAVLVIISRILSHFEHKKTNDKITIMFNGSLDDRVKQIVDEKLKERKDV